MSKTNKRNFIRHPPSELILELRHSTLRVIFFLLMIYGSDLYGSDLFESSFTLMTSVGGTKLQRHQHSVPKPAIC